MTRLERVAKQEAILKSVSSHFHTFLKGIAEDHARATGSVEYQDEIYIEKLTDLAEDLKACLEEMWGGN